MSLSGQHVEHTVLEILHHKNYKPLCFKPSRALRGPLWAKPEPACSVDTKQESSKVSCCEGHIQILPSACHNRDQVWQVVEWCVLLYVSAGFTYLWDSCYHRLNRSGCSQAPGVGALCTLWMEVNVIWSQHRSCLSKQHCLSPLSNLPTWSFMIFTVPH